MRQHNRSRDLMINSWVGADARREPPKQYSVLVEVAADDAAANPEALQLSQEDLPPGFVAPAGSCPMSLDRRAAEGLSAPLGQEPGDQIGVKGRPAHRLAAGRAVQDRPFLVGASAQ